MPGDANSPTDFSRYSRQTMLPQIGEEGQRKLLAASILVVGLGGLGSAAAIYLAGAGIGRIGLCDPDTVSLSNLQRQVLYSERMVGQPKASKAADRLRSLSSNVILDLHPEGLTPDNANGIISRYDLVVDCTDNFASRYLIDDTCAELGKPWVYGSIGEFRGEVAVMNHRSGRRYSDLYPDREALCALPRPTAGVIGALPGVVGALEASEAIKVTADFGQPLDGRLFSIDLLSLSTFTIEF